LAPLDNLNTSFAYPNLDRVRWWSINS